MIERPTTDQVQMDTARLWAARSTCSRQHVGAAIMLGGRTIGTGYNGAPAGMPHCNHDLSYTPMAGRDVEYKPVSPHGAWPGILGTMKDRGCRLAIHAEANALAYNARHGVAVQGADLFVTLSPCFSCAQLIIAAGLVRVCYDKQYRDPAGINLLQQAGVIVEQFQG